MIRSLKTRLWLAGLAVASVATGVVFAIDQLSVLPRLRAIEDARAERQFEQARRELGAHAGALGVLAAAWAVRPGALAQVSGQTTDFARTEVSAAALAASDVDLLVLYTADRRVALHSDALLAPGAPAVLPEFPLERAPAWPMLLKTKASGRSGLLMTGSGALFVAVRAIGDPAAPAGHVVMARLVDDEASTLATKVDALGIELRRAAAARRSTAPQAKVLSSEALTVSGAVLDVFGDPNLMLHVELDRAGFWTGRELASTNAVAMGGVMFGGMLLALLLIYRFAVRPTARLARHAQRLRESNDYSLRLDMRRRDEVGLLASQFDLLMQQVETTSMDLLRLSNLDPLTGVGNRRAYDTRLRDDWSVFARVRQPLAAIVCDVDDFKHYNDKFGHPAGDAALQQVALALTGALRRATDTVFRTGGEEFTVLIRGSDIEDAMQTAELLVHAVRALDLPHPGARAAQIVTISVGVASLVPERSADPASLITLADEAVYEAKHQGRNRAVGSARVVALRPRDGDGRQLA